MTESTFATSKTEPTSDLSQSYRSPPGEHEAAPPTSSATPTFKDGLLYNVGIPLLLLAGAGLIFVVLGSMEPSRRPPADMTRVGRLRALAPVRVERLQTLASTGQPLYLVVDGTVVPYREAKVAAEVAGRIVYKSEACEAGSYVRRDQLLMRIDPADHELEVQRLTRLREQEYQAIQELDQEMVNAQRLIEVAKQDVALQQRDVQRQTALPEGFASRTEVDQSNRSLLAATQQLVSVENQLELQRKRRVRLEASERLAAIQLQMAELNLKRTEIRAPIDGVIVSEDADMNTFVSRGSGLLTIDDTSKVEVATSLRMDQLYWVLNQNGTTVDVASRDYDLPETPAIIEYELSGRDGEVYRWNGRLMSYDGIGLDPTTRTVPVRVVVDDPTAFIDAEGNSRQSTGTTPLVRGMFVRVKLLIRPQSKLVVIPATAIQPGNRVFQFLPDESVLDVDPALATQIDVQAVSSDSMEAAPVEELEIPFDADGWEAGRVVIRKSVHPIDSLSIDAASLSNPASSAFSSSKRLWVCEVRDAELTDDSFVVVSPVGTIDEDSFPVRAERSGMKEQSDQAQDAEDSSAEMVVTFGEDA